MSKLLELCAAAGFTPEEFLAGLKEDLELISIIERKTNSEIHLEGWHAPQASRKFIEAVIAELEAYIAGRKADG
jgi:hypothetical protein